MSHLRQVHDNEQNYQEMSTILSGRRLITEEYPTTLALVLHSLCLFPLTQLHFVLLAFARVCTSTWTWHQHAPSPHVRSPRTGGKASRAQW